MITYKTDDLLFVDYLFFFCETKSFLWRMFFGWRKTEGFVYTFKVPESIIDIIKGIIDSD